MSQGSFPGFGPGIGARFGGFLSNPLLEQIFVWQVLQQITSTILGPEMAGLSEEMFKLNPSLQLSIADAVEAVIKSHMTEAEGEAEAALSGIKAERFRLLVASAGEPPGLDFLTEAWRRKFIPQSGSGPEAVSLEQGIKESRLKNKWTPIVEQMQFALPPPGVVVEGWLRAQIPEATARDLLRQNGIDDATATLMYKSAGRPPGPMEGIELYRRGVIPEAGEGGDTLSLRQLYLETDLKNKWYSAWLKLAEYIPPPRTVTALLRSGSITEAKAAELFKAGGLTAELAAVYVANAHHQNTASTRELTKAEVLRLYGLKFFTPAQVTEHLATLGYSAEVATLEMEYTDMVAERALVEHAINRVRSFYTARKIDEAAALASLEALKVDKAAQSAYVAAWRIERDDNVKSLTPAQILRLLKDGIEGEGAVLTMLEAEGYSPLDAWYLVAIEQGGKPTTPRPA